MEFETASRRLYPSKAARRPPLSAIFSPCVLYPCTYEIRPASPRFPLIISRFVRTYVKFAAQVWHRVVTVLIDDALDFLMVMIQGCRRPPLLQIAVLIVSPP
jgi:hypothetical protein